MVSVEAPVEGTVEPGWEGVREAFERIFIEDGELGAGVCIYKDGRPVVDLWGGYMDVDRERRWERDTLVNMASVDKFLPELGVLVLADRGVVSLDDPVATYWPKFAQNGKDKVTVRQMMAGLAGLLYLDSLADGAYLDIEQTRDAVEKMVPEWPVGSRGAYHSATARLLHAELIRNITGREAAEFIRAEITEPLGIDFHYGLDDEQIARTATTNSEGGVVAPAYQKANDPTTPLGRAWRIYPGIKEAIESGNLNQGVNQRLTQTLGLPLGPGYGAPRAISRLFATLANGGELDGVRLLSREMVDEMRTEQWHGICGQTLRTFRFGVGVFLHTGPEAGPWYMPFGPNPGAFGHIGAGGQLGVADPENNVSFAYGTNLLCSGDGLGPRCHRLLASVRWES